MVGSLVLVLVLYLIYESLVTLERVQEGTLMPSFDTRNGDRREVDGRWSRVVSWRSRLGLTTLRIPFLPFNQTMAYPNAVTSCPVVTHTHPSLIRRAKAPDGGVPFSIREPCDVNDSV